MAWKCSDCDSLVPGNNTEWLCDCCAIEACEEAELFGLCPMCGSWREVWPFPQFGMPGVVTIEPKEAYL